MTVSLIQNKVTFQGNGSTTVFAIPFGFISESSNLKVYLRDETTASAISETLQTITTHYTVSGSNLTMVTAPTSTQKLIINRVIPHTQAVDYIQNGRFEADTNEEVVDKVAYQLQGLQEQLDRTPKVRVTASEIDPLEIDEPVASQYLRWNSGATGIESVTGATVAADVSLDEVSVVTTTLANNQASAADVSGLVFSSSSYTSVVCEYEIKRVTDSVEVFSTGLLHLQYVSATTEWRAYDSISEGDAHGITFSIVASTGQVQYTSSNILGANYVGTIKVRSRAHDA